MAEFAAATAAQIVLQDPVAWCGSGLQTFGISQIHVNDLAGRPFHRKICVKSVQRSLSCTLAGLTCGQNGA